MTERANLPMLTLSYSDLITDRGFKYIFQTSATAGSQSEQALPRTDEARRRRLRQAAEDGRDHHGQHRRVGRLGQADAARICSRSNGLQLVVDETFTPPLSDATPLVQKVRAAQPDLLFFLPTVDFRRQARAGKDERVRHGPGQGADHLLRHRDRRAGHAADVSAPNCCRAS